MATTLLAIREVGADNIGVTIDFAHILYAGEMPAFSAFLANRYSKIFGIHLNDGYGKRDDGLMAGTINPVATVELFIQLKKLNYEGVIYFDTFPDHSGLNPIEESNTNILIVNRLKKIADDLYQNTELNRAIERQDATISQRLIAQELYGNKN